MREWINLIESASTDIAANNEANDIAHKFSSWFVPKNEETPLKDVDGVHFINMGAMRIAYVDAEQFGVDAPTLHIGFCWTRDGRATETRGLLQRARLSHSDPTVHYFVLNVLSKDSTNDTDLMFSVRWDTFIHELTHYFDFNRGFEKGTKVWGKKNGADYYNDPIEFNAHYQQGLNNILQQVKSPSERTQLTIRNSLKDFYSSWDWLNPICLRAFTYISMMRIERNLNAAYINLGSLKASRLNPVTPKNAFNIDASTSGQCLQLI